MQLQQMIRDVDRAEKAETELMQLRAELADCRAAMIEARAKMDVAHVDLAVVIGERDKLRELLREAFNALTSNEDTCIDINVLRGRIDAALAKEKP